MSVEETAQVWDEYSALVKVACSTGRLWTPAAVAAMAATLVAVVLEQIELGRTQVTVTAELIDQMEHGVVLPSLRALDAVAGAVEAPINEGRRLAGYLSTEAQPTQTVPPATVTRMDEVEASNDLADHLSAVLRHPLTPAKLRSGITETLESLDMPADYLSETGYLAALLSENMRATS